MPRLIACALAALVLMLVPAAHAAAQGDRTEVDVLVFYTAIPHVGQITCPGGGDPLPTPMPPWCADARTRVRELDEGIYQRFLRDEMGKAARELVPFDEAYKAVDWSRFAKVPAFDAANRINAYGTYLRMEQEALKYVRLFSSVVIPAQMLGADWKEVLHVGQHVRCHHGGLGLPDFGWLDLHAPKRPGAYGRHPQAAQTAAQ